MTTEAIPNIKVRKVNFNFDEVPRHYARNNIFFTHLINSMHIVFPEGEKFFIRSARAYMDQIKDDPELLDRVKKFIGQEGVHFKEHEKFWDVLEAMNLKPRRFARFYSYTAYNFLEKGVRKLVGGKGNMLALSVTAALEHFTALLGDGGLRANPFRDLPDELETMLKWHAAEELEHKAVCYDLYVKVGGTQDMKVAGMVIATLFLWVYLFMGQMYFVAVDDKKNWKTMPKDYLDFLTGWMSNQGMRNIYSMYLDYYKKDFHPDDHDNYDLAREFFEANRDYFSKMGVEA